MSLAAKRVVTRAAIPVTARSAGPIFECRPNDAFVNCIHRPNLSVATADQWQTGRPVLDASSNWARAPRTLNGAPTLGSRVHFHTATNPSHNSKEVIVTID